jgi:hypothetical protein
MEFSTHIITGWFTEIERLSLLIIFEFDVIEKGLIDYHDRSKLVRVVGEKWRFGEWEFQPQKR